MNHLEMPDALAGAGVEGHQALREQIVAGAVAAIKIVGGRLGRQIDVAQLEVGAHHGPDAAVAGVAPGFFLPGLDTEIALLGNRAEGPDQLAATHVVAANPGRRPFLEPGPVGGNLLHDHDIVHHYRRRHGAKRLGALPVHAVALRPGNAFSQVYPAIGEIHIHFPGFCDQGEHVAVIGADDHPRVFAIAPPGNPAMMKSQGTIGRAGQIDLRVVGP